MGDALHITGLVAGYRPHLPILHGVDLRAAEGKVTVIIGPNGAGKSTLIKAVAGLVPVTGGKVIAAEQDITHLRPDLLAGHGIAYVPQSDNIFRTLTVRENLAFWAEVEGTSVPEEVFAWFDLEGLADREAGTLSAGQRRRAGLARLAVLQSPLLLLDEPTVSLDRFSVRAFADWLTERHLAGGGAALIATHIDLGIEAPDLDLAPFRADPARWQGGSDEAFL